MIYKFGLVVLIASLYVVCADNSENELIDAISKIENEKSIYLFGGLSIEKPEDARSYQPLADNFLDRAEQYLQTHELRWNLPAEDGERNARSQSASEPRTRRLKKMLLPLLLILKLKMGLILPLVFLVIKFISLKALAVGTLALLFSGAALFKDLLGKKKDHITTAYITGSPLNAEIVHSDWNRNGQATAQELAYNYHTIPQPAF